MTLVALVAAALILGVAAFQVVAAAGAPVGAISWGGANQGRLPTRLRIASAVAVPVLLGLALLVLAQGGVLAWSPLPAGWLVPAMWIMAGLLANTLANVAAPSTVERFVFGGATGTLVVLCIVLALWGPGPG
jgi:hypothetical protein